MKENRWKRYAALAAVLTILLGLLPGCTTAAGTAGAPDTQASAPAEADGAAPADTPEDRDEDTEAPADSTGDSTEDGAEAPEPDAPEGGSGEVPEEEPEKDGMTPEEAARALRQLGILSGVPEGENGEAGLELDRSLTRQDAVVLISRIMGYNVPGPDPDYPNPFEDVDDFADAETGFAYRRRVASGISQTTFAAQTPVKGRELATFALRALGYGDAFEWQKAIELSDEVGLTDGSLGDGTGEISRGQASVLLLRLLLLAPRGMEKTYLTRLCESGAVSRETVEALGLSEYLAGCDETVLPASKVLAMNASSAVRVSTRNILQEDLGDFRGTVLFPGVVSVPTDALAGAMYADVTDSAGKTSPVKSVLARDEEHGITLLTFNAKSGSKPLFEEPPAEFREIPAEGALYMLADTVLYCASEQELSAPVGTPVTDGQGQPVGLVTLTGLWQPRLPGEDAEPVGTLYDLTALCWPDLLPPVKPRGIDPSKPMTAVTYDDGPSKTYTPLLLDLLEQYGAVATFFELGQRVAQWPQFVPRMEEMGCEVANHSWNHASLPKLDAEGVKWQIESTDSVIEQITGHDVALVRCPGGGSNDIVAASVGHPIIYWTIDTRDWESRDAEQVINHVLNDDKSLDGDIILMHSLYESTYVASQTIIPYILDSGYQTVTVSELAFFRGVELQNGVTYKRFPPKK